MSNTNVSLPNFPSLHHYMRNAAVNIKRPEDIYLLEKQKDSYRGITYQSVLDQAHAISAFFLSKGLST